MAIKTSTEQELTTLQLRQEDFMTDYVKVFYTNHKKFGEKLSYKINDTELGKFIEKVSQTLEYPLFKYDKEKINKYITFKFSKDILYVDENNNVIKNEKGDLFTDDKIKLFSENNVKIIFVIRPYDYKGEKGYTLKIKQLKFKKSENKYRMILFDD